MMLVTACISIRVGKDGFKSFCFFLVFKNKTKNTEKVDFLVFVGFFGYYFFRKNFVPKASNHTVIIYLL